MLKIKVQTVYTIARRGELEKVKLSRKCLRFRADDVQRYIERKASLNAQPSLLSPISSVTPVTHLRFPLLTPVTQSVTESRL